MFLLWAIAAFIIFNLCTGFFMEGWPPPVRFLALMLHVSSGVTVRALRVVRVVWRLISKPPPYPAGMKAWERHTAHVAHFLLYAAMVLMPPTAGRFFRRIRRRALPERRSNLPPLLARRRE